MAGPYNRPFDRAAFHNHWEWLARWRSAVARAGTFQRRMRCVKIGRPDQCLPSVGWWAWDWHCYWPPAAECDAECGTYRVWCRGCSCRERVRPGAGEQHQGVPRDLGQSPDDGGDAFATFERETGIKVQPFVGTTGDRLTKLYAEKGHPTIDVAAVMPSDALRLLQAGVIEPPNPDLAEYEEPRGGGSPSCRLRVVASGDRAGPQPAVWHAHVAVGSVGPEVQGEGSVERLAGVAG